jgi:hypothetical protein
MRRRRFEIDLGRLLRLGQQWRRRDDKTVWRVAQVHRLDCVAEMRRHDGRVLVTFDQLRTDWKWIATPPRYEEAA